MKVTIIGAGNMGRGIGTRAVAGGRDVELIDRNPEDARSLADELGTRAAPSDTINGDVVVLALPYEALAGALGDHRGALGGRIVVDIANPADWATMDRETAGGRRSLLPGSPPSLGAPRLTVDPPLHPAVLDGSEHEAHQRGGAQGHRRSQLPCARPDGQGHPDGEPHREGQGQGDGEAPGEPAPP